MKTGTSIVMLFLLACASSRDVISPPSVVHAPAKSAGTRASSGASSAALPHGTVALAVTAAGFEPASVTVRRGEPLTLIITRTTDATCAKDIVMPEHDIHEPLPLGQPVTVTFTPRKSGTLKYGCGMNQMISGVLLVE